MQTSEAVKTADKATDTPEMAHAHHGNCEKEQSTDMVTSLCGISMSRYPTKETVGRCVVCEDVWVCPVCGVDLDVEY